jgi:flagellar biogenesis protein FliO
MKSIPKWFLLPPTAALLLVLGPLSMQGPYATRPAADAAEATAAPNPAAATTDAAVPSRIRAGKGSPTPGAPKLPDLWQIGCALGGVLLLGVVAVVGLKRLRNGPRPSQGTSIVALRQTLRLSARQALHVVEFDDRVLLVGEAERGFTLLDSGRAPERIADEADVLARGRTAAAPTAAPTAAEDDDGGATPRNLIIPRPERQPLRRAPTPPAMPAEAPRQGFGLNDFRTLLQKAGRA